MNGSGMGVIALTALGGAIIVSTDLQSAGSSLAPTCTAPGLQKKCVDLNVGDIIN